MILEIADLQIKPGATADFETAFTEAQTIIAGMNGYRGHQLLRCIEDNQRYVLLVHWDTVAHHESGFRESHEYQRWKRLLHHFYDPFPEVRHYQPRLAGSAAPVR